MANPIALEREWDPALTLFFPATLQLPHGSGTGLTRREEGASSRPRAQRRESGQGSCYAPRALAAVFSPRPLLTVLCDCGVVVWHSKLPSHGAEQKRKLRRGDGACTGEEAGKQWAGSALQVCLLLCTNSKGHKIQDEQDKVSYLLPWAWSFPMLSFQVPFASSLLLNDAYDVASSSS